MPANTSAYLFSAYRGADDWFGDYDKIQVVFFEVDDTVTAPIYFGVWDPGMDASDHAINNPGDMSYRVYGGAGAYTDSTSRQLTYSDVTTARAGTQLWNLSIPAASSANAGYNSQWVWSSSVVPSQGEHVGNKYLFKMVVVAAKDPDLNSYTDTGDDFYNRYQLAVSSSGSGSPVPMATARVFAYSLQLSLEGDAATGTQWDLYPFVPAGNSTTDFVRIHSFDADYRTGNPNATAAGFSWALSSWDGTSYALAGNLNIGGDKTNGLDGGVTQPPGSVNGYAVGSSTRTGLTWRARLIGGAENGGEVNGADFWASTNASNADLATATTINVGGGTALRLYAAAFVAPTPDHVVITPTSQTLATSGTASFGLQIVDSSGNAVPEAQSIRIQTTGSSVLGGSFVSSRGNTDKTLTTTTDGAASFTVTDAAAEVVTVTLETNGASGFSTNFGAGADGSATVTFASNPPPTISSASSLSLTTVSASPQALPALTLVDSVTSDITPANDIRVILPAGLGAVFDTSVVSVSASGANTGTLNGITYTNGDKTAFIPVAITPNLGTTVLTGLRLVSPFTASSGSLGISWSGSDTVADAFDDKVIIIADASALAWNGSVSTSWSDANNWSPAAVPSAPSKVTIPSGAPNQPLLGAGGATVATLTLEAGATLSLAGSLTVSGALAVEGTLALAGNGLSFATLSGGGSLTTTSGTMTATGNGGTIATLTVTTGVTLDGSSGTNGIVVTNPVAGALTTTGKVRVNGSISTLTNSGPLTLNGPLTASGTVTNTSTVTVGSNTLSFAGYSGAGGTVSVNGGTVTNTGGASTIPTVSVGATGATLAGGSGITVTNAVTGNLTTSGAVSLNGAGVGTLTNGGTLTLNGTLTASGTLTNTSTLDVGSNALSFAGYLGAGGTVSVNGGTVTNTGGASTIPILTLAGSSTVAGGSGVTASTTNYSASPNVTTTGTVNLTNGTIGALTVTSGALTLAGGATSATGVTITAGTLTPGGNLTSSGDLGGAGTLVLAGGTATFATLTMPAGTITTTSGTLTATGNGGTIATLTVTTGVTLDGSSGTNGIVVTNAVAGALTTAGKVRVNGSISTLTNSGPLTLNGNLTLSGNLSQSGGSLTVPSPRTLTLNGGANTVTGGTLTIDSGAAVAAGTNSLSLSAGTTLDTSGALTVGNLTVAGTLTNPGSNTISSSGAVAITGAVNTPANSSLTLTGAASTLQATNPLGSLTVASTATGASVSTGALSLAGSLTLQGSSVLSLGALGLTVAGSTTVDGTLNGGSGTDSFAAVSGAGTLSATTGSTTISGGMTGVTFAPGTGSVTLTGGSVAAYGFNTLTVAGSVTSTGAWTVASDLTISSGTWTAGAFTHQVGGHWTNSGAFAAGGSTVAFTGAVTHVLSGATTFNNLSDTVAGSTLSLTAGQSFNVTGTLTLTGTAGNQITVQSTTASTAALANTAAQSVSFVRVGHVVAGGPGITAADSSDLSGDNTNWSFSAVSWLTSGTTNANLGSNWSSGVVPGPFDHASVPSGGTQPTQTGALSVKALTIAGGAVWTNGGQNLAVSGTLTNGGNFVYSGGSVTGWPATAGGTVEYAAGSSALLSPTGYTNLTVSGGTLSLTDLAVAGTFLQSGGSLTVPNAVTLTLNGASNTATGGTLTIASGGTVTAGTNAVGFSGTANLTTSGSLTAGDLSFAGTGTWSNTNSTTSAAGDVSLASYATPTGSTLTMTGSGKTLTVPAGGVGALTVNSAGTVTLGAVLTVANNLVLTSGILAYNGNLTVRGDVSQAGGHLALTGGSLTFDGSSGAQSLDLTNSTIANFVLNKTIGVTTASLSALPTSWTGNLSLTAGTLFLPNSSGTIGGNVTGAGSLVAAAVTGASVLTVSGSVGSAGTALGNLTAPASILAVGGSAFNVTTFTASGGTVEFGATTTVSSSTTFANLAKPTAGTLTFSGVGLTATGNLTITAGTVVVPDLASSVGGSVSGAGTLDLSASNTAAFSVAGAWSVANLAAGNGTVVFNGTAGQTLTSNGQSFHHLSVLAGSAKTVTTVGALTVGGNLEVGANQTLALGDALTVTGTTNAVQTSNGTITAAAGALTTFTGAFEVGTLTSNSGGETFGAAVVLHTYSKSTGTTTFNGTVSPQLLTPNSQTLGNVAVAKGAQAQVLRLAGDLTLADGSLTVTTGTLDVNGHTLALSDSGNTSANVSVAATGGLNLATVATGNVSLAGSLTLTAGAAFTPGTAVGNAVTFVADGGSGTIRTLASGGHSLGNLVVNRAGQTLRLTSAAAQVAGRTLTLTSGTLDLAGQTLTPGSSLVLSSGTAHTLAVGSGTLALGANSLTASNAAATLTVSTGTIGTTGWTQSAGTFTATGAASLNNAGSMAVTGGTWTDTTSTLTLTGAGTTVRFSGLTPHHLTVNAGGTVTVSTSDLAMGGNLAVTSGTFAGGGRNVTVTGTTGLSAGAGLTTGAGTLTFDGAATLAGTVTGTSGGTLLFNSDADWTGAAYTPNGESTSFGGGASVTFTTGGVTQGPVTVAKSGGTLTVTGALTAGTFGLSGGTVDVGTTAFDTGAFTQTGGTFTQTGVNGGTQRLASLTISGGTMTWDASSLGGTLEITGNYAESGAVPAFNLKNVTVGGTALGSLTLYDLTIAAGKTLTRQAGSALTVLRNLTIQNTGTYVAAGQGLTLGGGTVTSGTWTDSNATLQNLGPVTVAAGGGATTKTLASPLAMTSLTVGASATVDGNSRTLTVDGSVTGAGGVSLTTGTLSVGQDLTVAAFTRGTTDTVVLSSGTAGAAAVNGGYTFTNLTLNKAAKTDAVTPGGNETVTGALTLTQGTWAAGGNLLTTAGDWNASSANFVFLKATSTVVLTKTAAVVTQGADAFQNLTFNAGGALATNLVVAGHLVVSGGTLTDGAGARKLTVTGTTTVTAGAANLSWTNAANAFTGAVAVANSGAATVGLTAASAVDLGAFSLGTGTVSLTTGALTQSGPFVQTPGAGAVAVTAGANPVNLSNAGNDFTGALSISSSGANAVFVVDGNDLALGTVAVGSSTLGLTVGGNLTQAGPVTRSGAAAFSITAGGAVTLTNALNAVQSLGTVSRGGAFQLTDSAALTVNGPVTAGTISNALSITAGGLLTVAGNLSTSGANNLSLTGVGFSLAGTAVVDAGAGQLLVDAGGAAYSAAVGSNLTTTNAGASAVVLRNGTTAALGPVSAASGTLNLGTAGQTLTGNVTQTGVLTADTLAAAVGGTATVTLNSANTFTNLGTIGTNGVLRLTSTGAPTVAGAVTTGGHDLVLTTVGLTIGAGSLNVGAATVNLTNSASGTTSQTGLITAAGVQLNGSGTFTLGGANAVGTVAGNLTGGGTLTFGSANASLTVGTVTTDGSTVSGLTTLNQAVVLDVPSGPVTVSQPVSTGNGTIRFNSVGATQTAALTTTGGLAVNGAGNFLLELAGNSLANVAGSVTGGSRAGITSSGAVSVAAVAGVNGWTVAGAGVLTLTGTAAWTQTQPIQAAGLQLLGTGPATFTNASNHAPVVAGSLSAGTLSWTDSGAVDLGTVVGTTTSTGLSVPNATFVVGGALTQAQDLSVTTALSITAGTNAVTLSRGTNLLNTVAVASAGNLSLNDANGYSVTGAAATGTANLATAAGDVTITGAVSVTGSDLTVVPAGKLLLSGAAVPLVQSTGAGRLLFQRPVVLTQAATLTGTSGNIAFAAAATVDGTAGTEALTVNAGSATTTFGGKIGSITTLGNLLVTSAGATGVTLADTVSLAAGASATLTNGGTVLVSGAVSAPGGFASTGAGPVTVNGSLTVAGASGVDLEATAGIVILNAAVSTVSGAVLLEASGTTTVTAAGSIIATGASTVDFGTTQTGTLSTAGSITTVGGAVRWHRNAVLTGSIAVNTGGAAFTASGTLGGGGNNLTITSAGAAGFAGAVDNLALLTLTNSASLTASSTWGSGTAGAVTVTSLTPGNTAQFNGTQTNITTLTTTGGAYALRIDGSATTSTITSSSLAHTGTLLLGGADTARLLFTNGLDASAEASVTVRGLVQTANTPLKFGATTLAGATTLGTQASTAAGLLTLGAVTGASNDLTLQTGAGVSGANATIASTAGVGTLTLQNLGGTALFTGTVGVAQLTSASTVGLVNFADNVTATPTLAHTFGGPVRFTKAATPQTLTFSGTATFSAATDATTTTALVTLTASTLVWTGAAANLQVGTGGVTLDGNVTFASAATLVGSTGGNPTILFTNAGGNTVTLDQVTINGDPFEFQGTAGTTWVPHGQTFAAVKVNKSGASLDLSDAQLTTNAVTVLSPLSMAAPSSASTPGAGTWTVASGSVTVTNTSVGWADSRLVLQAGNLAVTGASGQWNLSTTVASPLTPRGLFFTGTGQTLANTGLGEIRITGSAAGAPVNLVGGTSTVWNSGDPTWAGGDWQLGSITHLGSITPQAASALYFFDAGVTLHTLKSHDIAFAGSSLAVHFDGFPVSVPHDVAFTGDLDLSSATVAGATTGPGAGNTVTMAGSGTLTFVAPEPGKTLHSLAHTGAGTLILGSDLGLSGDLTIAAGTLNAPGRKLAVQGGISVTGTITAGTNLQLYWTPDGDRTIGSSTAWTAVDLFVAGTTTAARTLTQATDLSVNRLTLLTGLWRTNGHNLTTGEDLVIFGPGFGTLNDVERATSRGATNGLFDYPYWSARAAYFTFLATTGFAAVPAGVLVGDVKAAGMALATGDVLTVGRNLYNHGGSMTAPGAWTLALPVKFTAVQPGDPSVPTEWFGSPFAVALRTSAAGATTITNSVSNQPVAAAWLLGPNPVVTNGGGNTNWDFTAPTVSSARTRFDNLVEIEFSEAMLNSHRELRLATGQTQPLDNLRFGSTGSEKASAVVQFEAGTGVDLAAGTAGEYATSTLPNTPGLDVDTRQWVAFQTTSLTWNTDATGASAGGGPSTDRSGVHRAFVPALTIDKGRLFDASGNPLRSYGENGAARYTATLDRARPVLLQVHSGQAPKHFAPSTPQDGHNYWHLQWSEPVNLVGHASLGTNAVVGTDPSSAVETAPNPTATLAFGDSYTDDGALPGQVQVTGLFRYPGKLYRSTRIAANDPAPQGNQIAADKVSNSLSRSSQYDLYVYLTGASTASGTSQYWDGFWWGGTNAEVKPAGKAYSVPPAYAASVLDLAGNAVEDTNITWNPSPAVTIADVVPLTMDGTWEIDRPIFAPYHTSGVTPDSYELVPRDTDANDKIDRVEFHVLANEILSGQGWRTGSGLISDTGHQTLNRDKPIYYGVRDSSLRRFHLGLSLSLDNSTFSTPATLNSAMDDVAPYLDNTGVDNNLFNGGPPPLLGFAISDDGYYSLLLNQALVPSNWKPSSAYYAKYNPYLGMATNLAGRLVEPEVNDGTSFRTVDRTPPTISLSLTGKGLKKVYVQFSREVAATDPLSDASYKNVLKLVTAAGAAATTNSVVSVEFRDFTKTAAGFQQLVLTLASPLTADDVVGLRLQAGGAGSIGQAPNYLDNTVLFPLTSVGLDLVLPVWASDGAGAEANTAGTDHVVHDFTGKESLTARDIEVQAKVFGGAGLTGLPLRMFYDFNVASGLKANDLWLPSGFFTPVTPKLIPLSGNTAARYLDPFKINTTKDLRNFIVPGTDSEMANGSTLEFLFQLGSLYVVRSVDPQDPTQMAPWKVPLKGIKTQKNGVTILHNVIDPTQGQKTQVLYTMARSGVVTVQVFALDGSLVKVLHRGRQASGDYSLFWDGKNEAGDVVARGVYFVRVVAPDVDETRNVMVIK